MTKLLRCYARQARGALRKGGMLETDGVDRLAAEISGARNVKSRKGNCYDNAVAESFFSTLKNELIHHQTYHTRDEASRDIFAFIEGFYNRQRLHQSLGYLSPLEFERRISNS